ncbi:malonic semialdehyde reductase [Hyphomicrobium methylovorum]|uniref:malonic semialdehyde reductase n=1 Tax=Hyphomicrobium methylovorum TaxID=84 RepID=UPI0015E66665|nr:malonic semialdehyde reductase [Hyphomicrobium methylovorum]MBA2126369.1 malonic semialdehyde reductase [Hyphomicrobium methylovorum]
MANALDRAVFEQLFDAARTHNKWQPRDVDDDLLKQIVDHLKWAPTSANSSPARIVFVKSKEAKERLRPHLSQGNLEKTMAAPVTAILAYDLKFYEHLPRLYPAADAKSWFTGNKAHTERTAFLNGSLQGAYFIVAARAMGLDCGPMSGFNNNGVDEEFFSGTDIKSNFLCNVGYGDPSGVRPRTPRFHFDEIAKIV